MPHQTALVHGKSVLRTAQPSALHHFLTIIIRRVQNIFSEEQPQLFLWTPVLIGLGILGYFSLSVEPSLLCACSLLTVMIGLIPLLIGASSFNTKVMCLASLLILTGFQLGFWRAHLIKTPMLSKPFFSKSIEGYVENIEWLRHKGRITGSNITLRLSKALHHRPFKPGVPATLHKVKIRINTAKIPLETGQKITVPAKLHSIPGMSYPGGYNMRRTLYFEGIGAKGVALGSPKIIFNQNTPQGIKALWHGVALFWKKLIAAQRDRVESIFYQSLPNKSAALATALFIGKTHNMPPKMRADFARSGMAHLLAVSGLHMSIIATLIFFIFQRILGSIPSLSLRYPLYRLAACATLPCAFLYLQLSGARIPATRAFWMTSIALLGISLGRSPFTLHLVAFAATLSLLIHPENILSVSFQLSFAAVTALIGSLSFWRLYGPRTDYNTPPSFFSKRPLQFIIGIFCSTLIAGFATMPFTVATFNQFTFIGMLTNILAIPLTSFFVMPLGLIFLITAPMGLTSLVATIWTPTLQLLIKLATEASHWPLASFNIGNGLSFAMPLFAVSGLWFFIWQTSIRFLSLPLMLFGILGLFWHNPPDFLMDGEGKVLAFYDKKHQTLWSTSRNKGLFTQHVWMQCLGALYHGVIPTTTLQEKQNKQPSPRRKKETERSRISLPPAIPPSPCPLITADKHSALLKGPYGLPILLLKDHKPSTYDTGAPLILSLEPLAKAYRNRTLALGRFDVWKKGTQAIWILPNKQVYVYTAAHAEGKRLWSRNYR